MVSTRLSIRSISSAVLSSELTKNLDAIVPPLSAQVKDTVRESVSIVFTLPDDIRSSVVNAYVDAVKSVFLVIVVGAAMCSLSSLLISRQRVHSKASAVAL